MRKAELFLPNSVQSVHALGSMFEFTLTVTFVDVAFDPFTHASSELTPRQFVIVGESFIINLAS